ncbi:uncharacterized protein LOC131595139 [Vicia villosa]|uniref:uncharacterized protein LOC131595139 n=1 Tax=Vicia villosa TaxID=3911 RepID=UPI00273C5394|nr:uncharacterized protein LOC131595139 [Vicia villosa]
MSRPAQLITDMTPSLNVWKIAVRVIDLWIVKERNGNQHLEAILQDIKGNQIHLITRNRELDAWKDTLLEHQALMVYNGEPLINDLPLKVCDNNYKLFFNATTIITSIDMPKVPLHTFNISSHLVNSLVVISMLIIYTVFIHTVFSDYVLIFMYTNSVLVFLQTDVIGVLQQV